MADGNHLVGVDIGSSVIKVVQLKEVRKGVGLVRAGFCPLPPQSIVDGHVMNTQAIVSAIDADAARRYLICHCREYDA